MKWTHYIAGMILAMTFMAAGFTQYSIRLAVSCGEKDRAYGWLNCGR